MRGRLHWHAKRGVRHSPLSLVPAMTIQQTLTACLLALGTLGAHAFQITSVSPQGEVAHARQIRVKFDEDAIAFGDPKAPPPLALRCSDAQAGKGSARWIDQRTWAYDFDSDLPPGVGCTLQASTALTSTKGTALSGTLSYRFSTGGPFVQSLRPAEGSRVDEEQIFVLHLSGEASLSSVQAHVWCATDGLGERIGVRLVDGKDRAAVLQAQGWERDANAHPLAYVTLACNRRLTPSAKLQLVYEKGVATPSAVANRVERRFAFQVREPFAANFSCERTNAQSDCLPLRPLVLSFNAPVSKKMLQGIRLLAGTQSFKPQLGADGATEENAAESAAQSAANGEQVQTEVRFSAPLPERTQFHLTLPAGFADASGRSLRNASTFPLAVATADMPPLAKFAAAPFGIVERFAEPSGVALLPVTLRNVEAALNVKGLNAGQVSDLKPATDADIIAWFQKIQRYDNSHIARREASADSRTALPKPLDSNDRSVVQTRMVSLLQGQAQVRTLDLPQPVHNDPRPFEVVGIPLEAGFHVVEIASQRLGSALLDARHGQARTLYVRTSALVTNLGVHFKLGRENAMAWVTTLDKGAPVAGAAVQVSDCRGRAVASGRTDTQGIARLDGVPAQAPLCGNGDSSSQAYFVSARAQQPSGNGQGTVQDLAFTWSDWNKGIEPWRFNVPSTLQQQPDERAHTILDRSLLRTGETVSMKHLLRTETSQGFGLSKAVPTTLVITHQGSGQQFTQALQWRKTATGGQSAESSFAIAASAKLGAYQIELRGPRSSFYTGQFRVEEFRLPVFEGHVSPVGKEQLVRARSVPVDVQVSYVSGGPAAHLPVRVSALVRNKAVNFEAFDTFSFAPPRGKQQAIAAADEDSENSDTDARVIADKLPLILDKNGSGKTTVPDVPQSLQPQELLLEASYADPNGEVQTLRSTRTLWPAAVVAGIHTESWVSTGRKVQLQALALDLNGRPQADVKLEVQATVRIVTSTRKRMVGGFYTYDNKTTLKPLGRVCTGQSDARGLLLCETTLNEPGEVELVAVAQDRAGNTSQAASSVYVTRQGELWFGGENLDRMDLLPEKKNYQPGETARFQVRMPFRFATGLLTVEREGIISSQVVQLNGQDPTVQLQVQESWGPNVYVSLLALRGRLREVPWYSFFTWGYKAPRDWWTSFWFEGRQYTAPTALVDLSKPAFRLGVAEIRVGTRAHQLDVSVKTDKDRYPVRGKAQVQIQVRLPNGQPAAHAEVALAAVDQALLELQPNDSWNLLEAMLQRRAWGVETSTAQMEIIGRRHYGRKAVAAGGGGGHSGTRELLDTLLLWNPRVQLDANGSASLSVPLNDALTAFKIVAVADASTGLFGTGSTSIRTTQDLQIISALPPLVREQDQFRAQLTLRNTTPLAMKVLVSARASMLTLTPQTVDIPAGDAREVSWNVTAPLQQDTTRSEALVWEIEARDVLSGSRDALRLRQSIIPAVPLTVQQASLAQLDGPWTLEVSPAAGALSTNGTIRGGLKLTLQAKLADGLPGVRDWFANYPFNCLEQKASKALGLRDTKLWQTVAAQIPGYLDSDGLASYFPPRDGEVNHGSDTLSAYLLAASSEASGINPAFALPDGVLAPMQRGLTAFVEGRIQRDFWSPRKDLDVRKLAAIEALSRYGRAQARMLGSITIAPNQWPTHAVIDWLQILKRLSDVPEHDKRMQEATRILRSRISYQGSKVALGSERDDNWWWLMQNGDVNNARLILAVQDDASWKDDMGRLANGLIQRQQGGAWNTTTANFWGALALEKFSAALEAAPVTGTTKASLGGASATVQWSKAERSNSMLLPWTKLAGKDSLNIAHQGGGKPWLTLQSLAAVELTAPLSAGYQIKKTMTPLEQSDKSLPAGSYSRGDVLRITLEVNASADMGWVVITDPVPTGATILGSGLGRDSDIAAQGERSKGEGWLAFEERSFASMRRYYEYLPRGVVTMEYTVRLNNVGSFSLPPSRVEAMYAPEMFGQTPNAPVKVEAVK